MCFHGHHSTQGFLPRCVSIGWMRNIQVDTTHKWCVNIGRVSLFVFLWLCLMKGDLVGMCVCVCVCVSVCVLGCVCMCVFAWLVCVCASMLLYVGVSYCVSGGMAPQQERLSKLQDRRKRRATLAVSSELDSWKFVCAVDSILLRWVASSVPSSSVCSKARSTQTSINYGQG